MQSLTSYNTGVLFFRQGVYFTLALSWYLMPPIWNFSLGWICSVSTRQRCWSITKNTTYLSWWFIQFLMLQFLTMSVCSVHYRFEGQCLESWWRRSFCTIFARFVFLSMCVLVAKLLYSNTLMHELLVFFLWQPAQCLEFFCIQAFWKRLNDMTWSIFRKRHSLTFSG